MKTVTAISIHTEGDSPVFGESVTTVSMDDEAGGFFLVLEQDGSRIRLEMWELEEIIDAAKVLLSQPSVKGDE